jgi:hypothetical protein
MKKYLSVLVLAALMGQGCLLKPEAIPRAETSTEEPVLQAGKHASLCISFEDRDGFLRWLDAYERRDMNALLLSRSIRLPDEADPKLTAGLREALSNEHTILRFLCVLDADANIVTWMIDDMNPSNAVCKAVQYTSIYGVGTIADVNADGRSTQCEELCRPKIQTDDMLVWQCDVREGPVTTWSELHQERSNGRTLPFGCREDEKGVVTKGCTR